jgi:hypothetical protein
MLANVRLVLDVEVMSGNKHTSDNSVPGRFWFAYMHKVCVLIDAETQGSDSFELLKLASFRQLLNWLAKMR